MTSVLYKVIMVFFLWRPASVFCCSPRQTAYSRQSFQCQVLNDQEVKRSNGSKPSPIYTSRDTKMEKSGCYSCTLKSKIHPFLERISGEPLDRVMFQCHVFSECTLDLSEIVPSTSDVKSFNFHVKCVGDKPARLILTNKEELDLKSYKSEFRVIGCNVHWSDVVVFAKGYHPSLLYLIQVSQYIDDIDTADIYKDVDGGHLKVRGLGSLGSLVIAPNCPGQIYAEFCHTNRTAKDLKIPDVLLQYYWPEMEEVQLIRVNASSEDVERFGRNIPNVQTFELASSNLTIVPNVSLSPTRLSTSKWFRYTQFGRAKYMGDKSERLEEGKNRRFYQMTENNFPRLDKCEFRGDFNKIILSRNNMSYIDSECFQNASTIDILDLSHNRLEVLPTYLFPFNVGIRKLYLSHNHLMFISDDSIISGLRMLTELDISWNRLIYLPAKVLDYAKGLISLDLSHNNIDIRNIFPVRQTVVSDVLEAIYSQPKTVRAHKIEYVDLSYNKISTFPTSYLFNDVQVLNLSHNIISSEGLKDSFYQISPDRKESLLYSNLVQTRGARGTESDTPKVRSPKNTIDLSYNRFKYLPFNSSDEFLIDRLCLFMSFFIVHWEGNPFFCDCNSYSLTTFLNGNAECPFLQFYPTLNMVDVIDDSTRNILCYAPQRHRGKRLVDIPPSFLLCPSDVSDCPDGCQCYRRASDEMIHVDCSSLGLRVLPTSLPRTTAVYNLENNGISYLPELQGNISHLSLANNSFVALDFSVLRKLKSLEYLEISHNSLVLRVVDSVKSTESFRINMTGLRVLCDCNSKWLYEFVRDGRGQIDGIDTVICRNSGKLLLHTDATDFVCHTTNPLIHLSIVVVVMCILIWIGFRIYPKVVEILLSVLRFDDIKQIATNATRRPVDVFISYGHESKPWVRNELIPRLENESITYIDHDKHFRPGEPIISNIADSLEKSEHVIFVITPLYHTRRWTVQEFRMAYDMAVQNRTIEFNFLIPVMIGDVSTADVEIKELRDYLATITCLSLKQETFWETLFEKIRS